MGAGRTGWPPELLCDPAVGRVARRPHIDDATRGQLDHEEREERSDVEPQGVGSNPVQRSVGESRQHGPGAGKSGHAHAPATVGGQAYAYDANGNVTGGGNRTYVWDTNNQPTSITGPDSVTETYAYDADGGRVSRIRAG